MCSPNQILIDILSLILRNFSLQGWYHLRVLMIFLFESSNTKWKFFYDFVWRFCIEIFFAANWLWLWQLQKHYTFSSLAYLGFIKLFLWFECCQGENYENPLSHEHNDTNQNPWFGLKRGKITLLKLWGNWDNLLQIYNCFSVEFFYKTLS